MANQSYQYNVSYSEPEATTPHWQELYDFYWIYGPKIMGRIILTIDCCGVFFNLATIVVFSKIGFTSSVNISFFALACADFYYSFRGVLDQSMYELQSRCSLCKHIKRYVLFVGTEQAAEAMTTWITTLITFERLCCIAVPMKVS